jgi:N utilization substance protein B
MSSRIHQGSQARKARICAMQMLYQWEMGREEPARVQEMYWREVRALEPREYASKLFEAATSEVAEVDAIITRFARRWKVERLPAVDRNLLRIAITEFRHSPEVPAAVVINETIEIAKMFSSDDSYEFLNGVLDAIAKEGKENKHEAKPD